MMNQAIHTLDLMQHLVPGKILSIRGVIGHLLDYGLEVEDTASAKIVFQNGIQGFFTATVANYENQSVRIKVKMLLSCWMTKNYGSFLLMGDSRCS